MRELGKALERAAILTEGRVLRGERLQVSTTPRPSGAGGRTMEAKLKRYGIS